MKFVTTDIHGDQKRFHTLLDIINLQAEDTLHILGDVVDRREHGISLLFEIMAMPNVRVILGNHEAMLLAFARNGPNSRLGKLWFSNHNEHTVQGFLALDKNKKHELTDYLESLPLSMDIESGEKKYHLVHGFPSDDDFTKLWSRPTAETVSPFDDRIVLIGHTPTCLITHPDMFKRERYLRQLKRQKDHLKIYYGNGWIDIDCACGYRGVPGALACLCLDTMEEFYVR